MNPFQEGLDDEEIPAIGTAPTTNGAISRNGTKLMSDQVNADLSLSHNLNDTNLVLFLFLLVEFRNNIDIHQLISPCINGVEEEMLAKQVQSVLMHSILPLMFHCANTNLDKR
jgi:hypothetical protein